MKIKIDKNDIKPCNLNNIKAAGKEFKAAYTDGDLLNAYQQQSGDIRNYGEILRATVEVFEFSFDDSAGFSVEMLTWNGLDFHRVMFFTDALLNIDLDNPLLVTVERYTRS